MKCKMAELVNQAVALTAELSKLSFPFLLPPRFYIGCSENTFPSRIHQHMFNEDD